MALIRGTLELLCREEGSHGPGTQQRPCLSLSRRNADKQPMEPADFAQRVRYMEAFRQDTRAFCKAGRVPCECDTIIFEDAPLFATKHALLKQKFPTIRVFHWIMGDDTFVRLLDPKYYEAGAGEGAMEGFFAGTRLFVFLREHASAADVWTEIGARRLQSLSEAQKGQIQFCVLKDEQLRRASSTQCRKLLAQADYAALEELLGPHVYGLFTGRTHGRAGKDDPGEGSGEMAAQG